MRGRIEESGAAERRLPLLGQRSGKNKQFFGLLNENLVSEVYFFDKIIEAVNNFIESLDKIIQKLDVEI